MDESTHTSSHPDRRSLWEVATVFLKIGAVGYGAAAIWGLTVLLVYLLWRPARGWADDRTKLSG